VINSNKLTSNKKDWDGIRNLVAALPSSVKRFVLVSSVGVTKFDKLPWRYVCLTICLSNIVGNQFTQHAMGSNRN
jgi:hypothetical protein